MVSLTTQETVESVINLKGKKLIILGTSTGLMMEAHSKYGQT